MKKLRKRWMRQCRYCIHHEVRKGCFSPKHLEKFRREANCPNAGWIVPPPYWVWAHAPCSYFELSEGAKESLNIIATEAQEKGIPLIEKLKETGLIAEPELIEEFTKGHKNE